MIEALTHHFSEGFDRIMYKDPDKQKEANRRAKARWKEKRADIAVREALGIPEQGIPSKGIPPIERIPKKFKPVTDKPYQMTVMERLFYKPANLLKPGETNFVSLPGRACYGVI